MTISLLILNGPGTAKLDEEDTAESIVPSIEDIRRLCESHCEGSGIRLDFRQSDDVRELCEVMETEQANCHALLLNPYSQSQASVAAADSYNAALARLTEKQWSIVELHLTNILAELDPAIRPLQGPAGRTGLVCGMGSRGYALAISALARNCQKTID